MNATMLQLSENTNHENPSKVAQWAENIGINLQRDFKRLLWWVSTQTLYSNSSVNLFDRKTFTFWKILIGCQHIIDENSDCYQSVIKFQRNMINSWMSHLKSHTEFPKPLDLGNVDTSLTFCSYSDYIGEPHRVQKS